MKIGKRELYSLLIGIGFDDIISKKATNKVLVLPQLNDIKEQDMIGWFTEFKNSPYFLFKPEAVLEFLGNMDGVTSKEASEILRAKDGELPLLSYILEGEKLMKSATFQVNHYRVSEDLLKESAILFYSRNIRSRFISADFTAASEKVAEFNESSLIKSNPDCSFILNGNIYSSIIATKKEENNVLLASVNALPFSEKIKLGVTIVDFGLKADGVRAVVKNSVEGGFTYAQIKTFVEKELEMFFIDSEVPREMMSFQVSSKPIEMVDFDEERVKSTWLSTISGENSSSANASDDISI